jgi:hypothetical protein
MKTKTAFILRIITEKKTKVACFIIILHHSNNRIACKKELAFYKKLTLKYCDRLAVSRKRIGKYVLKRSIISVHCYATFPVIWFTARSVTLTLESRYPRQRIVERTATERHGKINCWKWYRILIG